LVTFLGNGEIVAFRRYAKLVKETTQVKPTEPVPKIALIYGVGNIAPDVSESPGMNFPGNFIEIN
jgi:hypothetical protein